MCVTVLLSCLVLMYAGCKNSDHAYQLDSQRPTYDLIVNGLDGFAYDKTGETSLAEAEHMLKYLSSDVNIHSFADDVKCGLFKTGYHVTIWINTYGKTNNYGVRYGTNQDHSYLVSNSTYFEIQKPKASSPAQRQ